MKLQMTSPSKNNTESFRDVQNKFTQHMRDPENNLAPEGIEDRRMKVYRDLVYNNIEGFVANSFPVLRKIIADEDWHIMLRDFISRHISHTPYFPKLPMEFLGYLEKERDASHDPQFLYELAHYEWIEASLMFDSRDLCFTDIDEQGDLLNGVPVLSPLAMPLAYEWPVHMIRPDFIPEQKPDQATYLMVYRDRHFEIGFIELNPVSAKLVEELGNNSDKNGREILESIAEQIQHPNPEGVVAGGLEIMQDFKTKDILLGTR